jgi:hypothetical protein
MRCTAVELDTEVTTAAAWDNATVEKAYSTILKVSALSQALGLAPLGEGQHSPSNRSRLSVG